MYEVVGKNIIGNKKGRVTDINTLPFNVIKKLLSLNIIKIKDNGITERIITTKSTKEGKKRKRSKKTD